MITVKELFSNNVIVFDPPVGDTDALSVVNTLEEYFVHNFPNLERNVGPFRGLNAVKYEIEKGRLLFYLRFYIDGNSPRMKNYFVSKGSDDQHELSITLSKMRVEERLKQGAQIITLDQITGFNTTDLFDTLEESELKKPNRHPETGDFIYCHTNLFMDWMGSYGDGIIEATKGEVYEVTESNIWEFSITDNSGDHHTFSKSGVDNYTRWFTLISKEDREILNKDFFEDLTEEVKNPPTVGHKVYMIMHDSGKYVMSKNLTYGVHWVDIDDYGNREYDDYNMITFKTEGKAEEMLRLVNQTWSERDRRISGYKLNADYIDRYNPSEWQVIEYTLGLLPQKNLFESYERDFNYQNVQFNMIQNGKPNGVTYTITGRCKPDWVSQNDPDGWVVEWENHIDPHAFVQRPTHMKACIQLSSIVRSFSDGTYVPINLPTHDETDKLFTDLN